MTLFSLLHKILHGYNQKLTMKVKFSWLFPTTLLLLFLDGISAANLQGSEESRNHFQRRSSRGLFRGMQNVLSRFFRTNSNEQSFLLLESTMTLYFDSSKLDVDTVDSATVDSGIARLEEVWPIFLRGFPLPDFDGQGQCSFTVSDFTFIEFVRKDSSQNSMTYHINWDTILEPREFQCSCPIDETIVHSRIRGDTDWMSITRQLQTPNIPNTFVDALTNMFYSCFERDPECPPL